MKAEILHRFESLLPDGDTNPYRTGVWRPQTTEWKAWDLDGDGK